MKIGDYVRTKNGMIAKIIDKKDLSGSLHDTNKVFILNNKTVLSVYSKKVKKYSPNIIDLIEVGDYVDTHKVIDVYSPDGKQVFRIELEVDGLKGHMRCESKDIHSILTHEQFESMEYKVVE